MVISVGIDLGESLTKINYKVNNESALRWMAMHPGFARVEERELTHVLNSSSAFGVKNVNSQMWITTLEGNIALGKMAEKFVVRRNSKKPKYEDAVAKIMGAIAKIAVLHEISLKKIEVNLSLLLPFEEKEDKNLLMEILKEDLKSYHFCGQAVKVKLKSIKINSEGTGLLFLRAKEKGVHWIGDRNLAVIMLGHRNVSVVSLEKGTIANAKSPLLGFENLIDQTLSSLSGVESQKLVSAFWETVNMTEEKRFQKYPKWSKYEPIQKLATAHSPSLRNSEIEKIEDALDFSLQQYEKKLKMLFEDVLSLDLDEVIVGGGNRTLMHGFLKEYFGNSTVIISATKTIRKIREELGMESYEHLKFAERFLDIYGYCNS